MKWEYNVGIVTDIDNPIQANQMLDTLGRQGWELVSVVNDRFYFKRELQKRPDRTPEPSPEIEEKPKEDKINIVVFDPPPPTQSRGGSIKGQVPTNRNPPPPPPPADRLIKEGRDTRPA